MFSLPVKVKRILRPLFALAATFYLIDYFSASKIFGISSKVPIAAVVLPFAIIYALIGPTAKELHEWKENRAHRRRPKSD